ncbi:hypothetical protein [Sphingopyxis sp. 2PD]|uniref:hypothetical protein n=1 Tax=Sphingopyxis sp. 2PD TaxID=2502196 RepID=UPI0010F72BC1|nr:hypothetical protein [Sphingopyxis sp. 2PD]
METNDSRLAMFGQDTLEPEVRQAALTAAQTVLAREGVTAHDAVKAYAVDLLLAEGLNETERTDAHFREHGARLQAAEAYCLAREAAEAEIALHDNDGARFAVLFSVAD